MKRFCTYILLCADHSYYVGVTNDVETRVGEHQSGIGSLYTPGRLPVSLVFVMEFPTAEDAIRAEKQLRGWSRKKKEALIEGDYARLHHFARCRNVTSHENCAGTQDSLQNTWSESLSNICLDDAISATGVLTLR